jgi:hypothetical protein
MIILSDWDNIDTESQSIGDIFMDILVKGLSYMNGSIKIAINNNASLKIESADKNIKLDITDPSFFEIAIETLKDNKANLKDNKITDFFKYIKEAKEFAHKLSENELTLSILNRGENAITLGKNANPKFSKLITRSDDIQIDSVRKSFKLASDIDKEDQAK